MIVDGAMDPLVSAVLLGFVLGVQHASDPDHLVAVATIVTRERRFSDGAAVGLLWGLGHTLTLGVFGLVLVVLDVRLPEAVGVGFELVVAAVLVGLGVVRLRDAARDLSAADAQHLAADHGHDGREIVHSHPHTHGEHAHGHPHVHPSKRLLAALGAGPGRIAGRAILVGAVHGMAGSGAVSLLVLATLPSTSSAILYLAVFGLGTLVGMTALTAVMAYPVRAAARLRRARRALAFGAGLGSIAFGLVYAYTALSPPS